MKICPVCNGFIEDFGKPHKCTTGNTELHTFQRCEHCYCLPAYGQGNSTTPHRKCCKCGSVMAERFING